MSDYKKKTVRFPTDSVQEAINEMTRVNRPLKELMRQAQAGLDVEAIKQLQYDYMQAGQAIEPIMRGSLWNDKAFSRLMSKGGLSKAIALQTDEWKKTMRYWEGVNSKFSEIMTPAHNNLFHLGKSLQKALKVGDLNIHIPKENSLIFKMAALKASEIQMGATFKKLSAFVKEYHNTRGRWSMVFPDLDFPLQGDDEINWGVLERLNETIDASLTSIEGSQDVKKTASWLREVLASLNQFVEENPAIGQAIIPSLWGVITIILMLVLHLDEQSNNKAEEYTEEEVLVSDCLLSASNTFRKVKKCLPEYQVMSRANLRVEPKRTGLRVTLMQPGQRVRLMGREGTWLQLVYETEDGTDIIGWAYYRNLAPVIEETER